MALKGDLPMKIIWYFNDARITTIENGIHVVMTSPRISQLTIESVTAYHRGQYRCVAENNAGQNEYSAELRVNGTYRNTNFDPFVSQFMNILKTYRSFQTFVRLFIICDVCSKRIFSPT